jgi:hypothetical protein
MCRLKNSIIVWGTPVFDRKMTLIVAGTLQADSLALLFQTKGTLTRVITSLPDLQTIDPDHVQCLVCDGGCQPLVNEILRWSAAQPAWRALPKTIVLEPASEVNNLDFKTLDGLRRELGIFDVARETQAIENRRHFRHPIDKPVSIAFDGVLVDLSAGGLSLDCSFALEPGFHVKLELSKDDPLLREIVAEVVRCRRHLTGGFCAHMKFVNNQPGTERALERYLLASHARRSRLAGALPKTVQPAPPLIRLHADLYPSGLVPSV